MKCRVAASAVAICLSIVAAWQTAAHDTSGKPVVGILSVRSELGQRFTPFRLGLHELGYDIGRNLEIESRFAGGEALLPTLAAQLVRLNVAVLLTVGEPATRAARQATTTTPIVFVGVSDPVATELVTSLTQPVGNVTGVAIPGHELGAKRLELLKEALPKVSQVAVLRHPGDPATRSLWSGIRDAGRVLGLKVEAFDVRAPAELEPAVLEMSRWGADALVVLPNVMFQAQRATIADLAVKHRLATTLSFADEVEAGGLMVYRASDHDLFRRAARLTERILRGASPDQLPVERATVFDLVINLKTAEALGVSIPPALLRRADGLIQ